MSYPERTSSSKRHRRIASASVSSISSNWAAVTRVPPSLPLTTGSQFSVIGSAQRPLEVQSLSAEGLGSPGEHPSSELRPPSAGRGSDGREVVEAGPLRLVLAVDPPREEEQPAEDD